MKTIVLRGALTALGLGCTLAFLHAGYSANATSQKNTSQPKTVDVSVLFDKHCDTCHGKDGQAKTFKAKFNHARNLTDAKWQSGVSDERLFNSISNGKGKMPAFRKKLSETQINGLVAFVRRLKR
ncbi:MAG: cytochrome c [Acidobacteriota bacterium]|nr:cytochrome c [Acidobacteriota bacterium]